MINKIRNQSICSLQHHFVAVCKSSSIVMLVMERFQKRSWTHSSL